MTVYIIIRYDKEDTNILYTGYKSPKSAHEYIKYLEKKNPNSTFEIMPVRIWE